MHWILSVRLGDSSSTEQSREPEAGKALQGGHGGKPKMIGFYGKDEKQGIRMGAPLSLS